MDDAGQSLTEFTNNITVEQGNKGNKLKNYVDNQILQAQRRTPLQSLAECLHACKVLKFDR